MTSKKASELFEASDHETTVVERRQAKVRVKRDRRRGIQRSVGLEVSPSGIALAIVERGRGGEKMIVEYAPFPADSGPRRGDWTDGTLVSQLTSLAAKYNLGGQAVKVGLGGDPCVTRVVAGPNEEVDNELAELAGRTERYIGMGFGEKVSCETSQRIDARRKRVWVTVAMRDVVDAIADAIRATGMRLARLEHTMLILCRILNRFQQDSDEPVMMIVDELGRMDLGISFQGRLLVDYRPAMPNESTSPGSIVQRHLKCLQRYTQFQVPDHSADLDRVFVTGSESEREMLDESLAAETTLQRHRFPLDRLCDGMPLEGEVSEDPGVLTAIGLATINEEASGDEANHDLVATLGLRRRFPWLRLARHSWPIALAASVALALILMANHQRQLAAQTERQIESLTMVNAEANHTRLKLKRLMSKNEQVQSLSIALEQPEWAKVIWKSGMCLPQGMWLESIQIDEFAAANIVGSSHTNEGIYDYIDQLRRSGAFSRVALESTNRARMDGAPSFRFEISAQIDSQSLTEQSLEFAKNARRGNSNG